MVERHELLHVGHLCEFHRVVHGAVAPADAGLVLVCVVLAVVNQHVDALAKRIDLRVLTHAAEHDRVAQRRVLTVARKLFRNLQRQLSSGRKDQRARAPGLTMLVGIVQIL